MRIYVGNLQFDFTEEELRGLFSDYGQVESASIARDRDTQRSKGFAFVEMLSSEEARAAITALVFEGALAEITGSSWLAY